MLVWIRMILWTTMISKINILHRFSLRIKLSCLWIFSLGAIFCT
ncbi:MAG: hypothetical protein AAGI90_01045 [Chlamydiota bacterium]